MSRDTNEKIFGYDWTDIQRAQQGGSLHRPLKLTPAQTATDADRALFVKFGSLEALREAGLHGVVDRLARGAL